MAGGFYFKVHKHSSEVVIAVCDEEILGQTFTGEGMRFYVSPEFYGGDLVDGDFVRDNIGSFTILNIIGNRAVDLASEKGIVSPGNILVIGGVKHAQAVRM